MASLSEEYTSTPTKALASDYDGHNMVFIVGCARSGTTWLQRLLASHPKMHTGQETGIFSTNIGPQLRAFRREAKPNARNLRPDGLGCYFTEDEFCRIVKGYLLKLIEPMVAPLAADELFVENPVPWRVHPRDFRVLASRSRDPHASRCQGRS